jgi:spore maturation protein SpmB
LNELEQFAKEAGDREWMAFLGATSPLVEPPHARGVGEDGLQDLHHLAKAAFVDEVASHCRTDDESLTWALSMVDEQDLDAQIAKAAMALEDEPDSVCDFVFSHAGLDTPLEDFHELAKRAFVEELHGLCGGDVTLVKEALALVDDDDFDTAVASEAMGIEKEAFIPLLRGVGRAGVGRVRQALGGAIKSWGTGAAKAHQAQGAALRTSGKKLMKPTTLKVPGTSRTTELPAGFVNTQRGKFQVARSKAIQSDIAAGRGAGSKRTRFGDWMMGNKPAATAGAKTTAKTTAKTDASTLPMLKDKPPVVDPKKPPVVDPKKGPGGAEPEPNSFGTAPGTWNSLNEWFTNATPLQQMMVGGGGMVAAEAALD